MTDPKSSAFVPPINWDNVTARSAIHDRLLAEARPINRDAVLAALAAAAITHVTVRFDGYGDSGQIEGGEAKCDEAIVEIPEAELAWLRTDWNTDQHQHERVSLRLAIENVVYDCLEETHQGWEINDGAFGEVTFDVAERTVTLDYNARYSDIEYFQHIF
ncbi:MAG: DUF6878 family protein [Hyphomicrobiaceae bacterium]